MLDCHKDGIIPPDKVFLFTSKDSQKWSLAGIEDTPACPNTNHDAFIDFVLFEGLQAEARYLKIAFTADHKVYMDTPVVNP